MITKIQIQLSLPENILPRHLGSVLHGWIMEQLSNETAEALHHNYAYSPLKQRIYYDNDVVNWEIVSLNEQLTQELMGVLSTCSSMYLRYYDKEIKIGSVQFESINIPDIINSYLNEDKLNKFIKIKVRTPMSFKSNKQYLIFPDEKKFFRSIMLQFDSFFSEYQMYDRDTLDFLEKNVRIVNYNMKSTRFHLEKVKIPSFIGEIVFKVDGPKPFLQLIHFLLKFGEYTGSGIKTSLGMGKYNVIEEARRHN